ncbi:Domain of unknown function DUF4806 [Cinara cedri]|uniref:Uncharacterized protein n=1 Tax=Cinara cedri TaxID=506608 RepID=A0A5E4NRR4_9HEMI|nr:Domain of unknown function DUF4806 [Cinara cedri]
MDKPCSNTVETSVHGTISKIRIGNIRIHKEIGSRTIKISDSNSVKKGTIKYNSNIEGTCCNMNVWCHPGTFKMPRMTSFMFPILCKCDVSQKKFVESVAMIPRLNITFPLLTQETVIGIEALLIMDKEYRDFLIEDLYYLESGPLITYTKRIMNVLFSNVLLSNYAFKSQRVNESMKESFSDLKICQVIIDAIRKHDKYKDDYSDIELKIKAYLTQIWYSVKLRKKEEHSKKNS